MQRRDVRSIQHIILHLVSWDQPTFVFRFVIPGNFDHEQTNLRWNKDTEAVMKSSTFTCLDCNIKKTTYDQPVKLPYAPNCLPPSLDQSHHFMKGAQRSCRMRPRFGSVLKYFTASMVPNAHLSQMYMNKMCLGPRSAKRHFPKLVKEEPAKK